MNKLKLKEATENYVVYFYQPEGKGSYGEIHMNIGGGNAEVAEVLKKSNDDISGRYAFKAAKAVTECVHERNLPLDFMQAWT